MSVARIALTLQAPQGKTIAYNGHAHAIASWPALPRPGGHATAIIIAPAERTHEWLAAAELPLEYEYSAKRAAKWKERCEAYASRAHREPPEAHSAPRQPDKQPNIFKRFLACITIEPW